MNFDIVALIIAIVSFFLLVFLIFRKIPQMKFISDSEPIFFKKEFKNKIREKTKEVIKGNSNFLESFLHKILSRTRILFMKADKKLSDWIISLRLRSSERSKTIDSYWNEIKDSINKKK
ncbi:MAG: hypothetical protein PHU17_02550 [Candidatus Pacebacteria bacterium]|nr:hypothetical protein [Candidatus Paceibacterota bacterium]MDD4074375.1 hypothetical protein [Candidatus Paceibacterota bacterium]